MAAKEIVPVLFFGYDSRFIPETSEPPKHSMAENETIGLQSIRRMDFRPQPIIEKPPVQQDEARDESPKVSSATEPASGSSEGSPTSQQGSEGDPANAGKVQTPETPIAPPLL